MFEDCDEPLSLGVLAISRLFGTAELFSVSHPEHEKPLDEISFTHEVEASYDIDSMFDPSKLSELKTIVQKYGQVLFAPFDRNGSVAEPLDIELIPNAQLKVQPALFINRDILSQVQAELKKLEDWGVIKKISDAEMASPLVLVKKPDNSIRVAVDYRELYALIKPTANQLPYQKLLFSKLVQQKYLAKVDNLCGY